MKPKRIELETVAVPFDRRTLNRWRGRRDFSHLTKSAASAAIKAVLCEKAKKRSNRFFGEAQTAVFREHQDGFYCPFKWLTSPTWCNDRKPAEPTAEAFKQALQRYFPSLPEFQAQARRFEKDTGVKPVGPDLWLIKQHEHEFLEVKMPGDHIREPQLAGLALIATRLKGDRPIRVSVAILDPSKDIFHDFIRRCDELGQ